ncbi:hypothetical protein CHUAL_006047 [Chamberlinius hualienensis]
MAKENQFLQEMDKLSNGCLIDDFKKDLTLTVYNHLKDVCDWRNMKLKYCKSLNLVYLCGNLPDKSVSSVVVVPMDGEEKRNFTSWRSFNNLEDNHRVVIAFCGSDGTVVLYELEDQLNIAS